MAASTTLAPPPQRRRSGRAKKHMRINPDSVFDAPAGYRKCPIPTCSGLVELGNLDSPATCNGPEPHELDPDEEARIFMPTKSGGFTHVGLTMTRQGQIAEQVVLDLKDLGEFGRVSWWSKQYNSPLDGATDCNWGIEVKSASTRTRHHSFNPGNARTRESKNKLARERGYRGIVGALVILNFELSTASIYLKGMQEVCYFARSGEPFAVVSFDNPLIEQEREPVPF